MTRLPPSPYATKYPTRHEKELQTTFDSEVFEFFHPFAFIDGVAEIVRVLNPTYGAMDLVVVLPPKPTDVYVNSDAGERFLRDRFPALRRHRVAPAKLQLSADDATHAVRCHLESASGPLRRLDLTVRPHPSRPWEVERYESEEVWGAPLQCHGVDLRVVARAEGTFQRHPGTLERLDAEAILYLGSFGRLTPRQLNAQRWAQPGGGRDDTSTNLL